MAEEKDVEFISSHKYMKNTSTCGTIFTEFLLNAGRDLIMPKLREKNHHITRTIKEKTEIRMGPASLGGSCEKVPSNWETFTSAGRSVRTEKELQRIRGEQSTQLLAVRTERPAQRVLPASLHSPAQDVHPWCAWGLSAESLGFSGQTWGEDWGLLHRDRLKALECGLSCNRKQT